MRLGSTARARASAVSVRGVERAVVVGAWGPKDAWMRRRFTPASSRGVAELCRNVCTEARVGRPLACRAARKASWTLWRGMGVEAVDIPRPLRPDAGKSHTGWRWVVQSWRSDARIGCGRGTERSWAPVPRRTWTTSRALSLSGTCKVGACLQSKATGVERAQTDAIAREPYALE